MYHNLTQGESLDSEDYFCLTYGLGLISLSSSMYIKEMDPKLLDKAPFWKTAYNWAKEKISSLAPQPAPTYSALEDYLR